MSETTFDQGLHCTCPDFTKRLKQCKHCLFVLARVLGVSIETSSDLGRRNRALNQRILLIGFQSENHIVKFEVLGTTQRYVVQLDTQRNHNHGDSTIVMMIANDRRQLQPEHKQEKKQSVDEKTKQRDYIGEDCGICYETFTKECEVVYCKQTCGRSIHTVCFERFSKIKRNTTCPYCRAPMKAAKKTHTKKSRDYYELDDFVVDDDESVL